MPFMASTLVAIDPIVLFACAATLGLILQWDGQAWALATPQRRRWTAAVVSLAAFVYFYLPRGDFWWCVW